MAVARTANQLSVTLPARVGLLAEIGEALREAGVDIRAVSAYERDGQGKFLLVTADDATAREALERFHAEVAEHSVVEIDMPDEPGALEEAARTIAEAGVNVEYVYGTAAQGPTGPMATLVFRTSDDVKVAGLF